MVVQIVRGRVTSGSAVAMECLQHGIIMVERVLEKRLIEW